MERPGGSGTDPERSGGWKGGRKGKEHDPEGSGHDREGVQEG